MARVLSSSPVHTTTSPSLLLILVILFSPNYDYEHHHSAVVVRAQQTLPPDDDRQPQPNIIVMQPDDLTFFDAWGRPPNNPDELTRFIDFPDNDGNGLPNIERLRLNGLQMLQAYTASPVCGTSRYSTITDKYPSRAESSATRNTDNDDVPEVTIPTTKLEGNDCSTENLAAAFSSEGYRTAMVGKWHLSRLGRNEYSYETAVNTVENCGFEYVDGLYIENLNDDETDSAVGTYRDGTFSHNMEWITHVAIDFMQQEDVSFVKA